MMSTFCLSLLSENSFTNQICMIRSSFFWHAIYYFQMRCGWQPGIYLDPVTELSYTPFLCSRRWENIKSDVTFKMMKDLIQFCYWIISADTPLPLLITQFDNELFNLLDWILSRPYFTGGRSLPDIFKNDIASSYSGEFTIQLVFTTSKSWWQQKYIVCSKSETWCLNFSVALI